MLPNISTIGDGLRLLMVDLTTTDSAGRVSDPRCDPQTLSMGKTSVRCRPDDGELACLSPPFRTASSRHHCETGEPNAILNGRLTGEAIHVFTRRFMGADIPMIVGIFLNRRF